MHAAFTKPFDHDAPTKAAAALLDDDTAPEIGIWELVRAEMGVELANGGYVVRFAGQIADRGTFELGGTREAKTMLIRGVEGPNAGRTIPCIYQQVGERLRVCYGLGGVEPTDFTTAISQQRYLATYRRTRS